MHIIINILIAVLFVGGAFLLFSHFLSIDNLFFGSLAKKDEEGHPVRNNSVANVLETEYYTYLLSIAVGAVMEIGNAIGGSFLLGFHGFWSSLCTLTPIILFSALSLNVYFILELEGKVGRIAGRIVFLFAFCAFGVVAGAYAMALIFIVICLVLALVFAIFLLDGGKTDRIKIMGQGLFGGSIDATRNADGTYTDEYGGHWRKNYDDTVTKI